MKRTLKERIESLGLSFQKEMLTLAIIIILSIALSVVSYIFLKEIIIPLITIGFGVIATYFYLSRYSALEKKKEKDKVEEFISLLSYFEVFISNGNNVYTSFKYLLPYSSNLLQEEIETLLNQIDVDKTVGPFINFASKFNNRTIESLMLSIYQMVDNGENSGEMTEFNVIFANFKEKHLSYIIERKKKSLESLGSFPLIGAGAITLILSISIISIIGDFVNVI